MMSDALATGDKHKEWRAGLINKDIDSLTNKDHTGKREDSLVIIHKFIGGSMPSPREMTVDQFYYNMDFVNRGFIEQRKTVKNG